MPRWINSRRTCTRIFSRFLSRLLTNSIFLAAWQVSRCTYLGGSAQYQRLGWYQIVAHKFLRQHMVMYIFNCNLVSLSAQRFQVALEWSGPAWEWEVEKECESCDQLHIWLRCRRLMSFLNNREAHSYHDFVSTTMPIGLHRGIERVILIACALLCSREQSAIVLTFFKQRRRLSPFVTREHLDRRAFSYAGRPTTNICNLL